MSKLKVGVIGCGSIAQNRHLIEYQMNESVEIVAVCDIVLERAEKMAALYQAQAYGDYEKVLLEDIDAISVCLPNYLHAPVSIKALQAGKHVLCEKPMAISSKEAVEMIQASDTSGKKLMIAHNQRFVASHAKARELIQQNEIGKVYSFRTTFGHGGPESWSIDGKNSWFFKKDEAFIGAMGDLGVHKADLIRYLLGEEFQDISAFIESSAKENSDVDDNAVFILRSETGVIGTLTASWSYNTEEDNSTIIYGEKGVIRLEADPKYGLILEYSNGEKVNYALGKIQSNETDGQTTTHVIDHFVDCVLNNKQPLIDGSEGKKSLELILAAVESNETKQITTVKR